MSLEALMIMGGEKCINYGEVTKRKAFHLVYLPTFLESAGQSSTEDETMLPF